VHFICPLSRTASLSLNGSEQGVDGGYDADTVGFGAEAVDDGDEFLGGH